MYLKTNLIYLANIYGGQYQLPRIINKLIFYSKISLTKCIGLRVLYYCFRNVKDVNNKRNELNKQRNYSYRSALLRLVPKVNDSLVSLFRESETRLSNLIRPRLPLIVVILSITSTNISIELVRVRQKANLIMLQIF